MHQIKRLVFLLVLVTFSAGCSGYSLVPSSDYSPTQRVMDEQNSSFESQQKLRVYLKSGDVIEGKYCSMDEVEIRLLVKEDNHVKRCSIELAEVSEIRRHEIQLVPTMLAVVLGTISAANIYAASQDPVIAEFD